MRVLKGLTDIAGVKVGHASDFDGLTGCTVILTETGAVGGADLRGSATGTEEMDVLSPMHTAPVVHAIVLAGGSAFGLEALSGVRRVLEKRGVGFPTAAAKVPIVAGAILLDLAVGKASARPTREMGALAAELASDAAVEEGSVGAGTGASVGKLLGIEHAMKGGVGSATVHLSGRFQGVRVAALAVTNPLGDVLDPATGQILAGARRDGRFLNSAQAIQRGEGRLMGENTTLAVVATNARLSKVEATKLAQLAQHGIVRTISPVHTTADGDVVFALSLGSASCNVNALGAAAAEALAQAIVRSVKTAKSLGGLPSAGA
jgi:L-aminopeptidase/D-esterase-like protein